MKTRSTADQVLFHLKRSGTASTADIAEAFSITAMGAHKILQGLLAADLVVFEDVTHGRGRPKRVYRLSALGHGRFPDRHADLTVEMIADATAVFGMEGLERLIAAREQRQKARYQTHRGKTLKAQLDDLAAARTVEGYMARVEEADDGAWLLIEDHCPICAAATVCQGFCRSELEIFRDALGPNVNVERQEHLPSGDRRCSYRVTADPKAAP